MSGRPQFACRQLGSRLTICKRLRDITPALAGALHQRLPGGADNSRCFRRCASRVGEQAKALAPSLGIILSTCTCIMGASLTHAVQTEAERLSHEPVPRLYPHARDVDIEQAAMPPLSALRRLRLGPAA
eukprot:637876-Pyramimonas_sp.AAC.1